MNDFIKVGNTIVSLKDLRHARRDGNKITFIYSTRAPLIYKSKKKILTYPNCAEEFDSVTLWANDEDEAKAIWEKVLEKF